MRYSKKQKQRIIDMYNKNKSYTATAKMFGCAYSTVYYAVNPHAYEHHKEHVYAMRNGGKSK